jgi:parallel beta-helix repeat protein
MTQWLPSFAGALAALALSTSAAATTYHVAPGGSDSNSGSEASPFATIQHAADVAAAGDTIDVAAGVYAGARFSTSGTPTAPITLHGAAGAVVDRPGPRNSNGDNLWVRDASFVTIEGFESRNAPRAGIAVQAEPDTEAHGVVLRNNTCYDNGRWGIFTAYAEGVVITGNETSFSADEHGIYVSNSADNPVVTHNVSHHNNSSGIQINADPAQDGDGRISNALVAYNVIYENGTAGAAGINLASVVESRIIDNLLYDNHATGIAGWDDGAGNEWGTHDNLIANNTIVQAPDARFAISLIDGSTRNTVVNNILVHTGSRGSIEIDSSAKAGLVSDFNVLVDRFAFDGEFISADQWRSRGYDAHSIFADVSELFVDAANSDYRLRESSPAIDAGTNAAGVSDDLAGVPRPQGRAFDIGAYEAGGSASDFSLSIDPGTIATSRGATGQIVVTVARTGGFTGEVTIVAPDAKSMKIRLTPPSGSTGGASVSFDFKVKKSAKKGPRQLVFTGTAAGITRTTTVTLVVQ